MRASTRDLLRIHDDPKGQECPGQDWKTFPYDELVARVRDVQRGLHDELSLDFERDGQVQDASFHDELRILSPEARSVSGVTVLAPEIAIRFSNFGNLAVIHTCLDEFPAKYPLAKIRAIVKRFGWQLVPVEDLDEIYDGSNDTLRDGRNTWWIRFFDYL